MNIQGQTTNGNGLDNFLAYLQDLNVRHSPASSGYREAWLKQMTLFDQVLPQHNAPFFLWDLATAELVFLRNGNDRQSNNELPVLTDAAFAYLFSNIHPDYQTPALLFYRSMIDAFFRESVPATEKAICHFNFLYKRKTGGYLQLLQQIVVAEWDEKGRPLLLLCLGYDITYLLKEHTANLILAQPQRFYMWRYSFAAHRLEPVHPLTVQEQRVLQALAEGKDTRDTAAALHTSPHTIDTHRRNLLRKTGCIDTTALITYLKMVGYVV